ncbi:MAG: hypothetical protein LBH58_10650 [Tannerellaceae bacterium]|jgi:hypothetical protein|nr:hypothetical protein [Tannerellaceae bacterium]
MFKYDKGNPEKRSFTPTTLTQVYRITKGTFETQFEKLKTASEKTKTSMHIRAVLPEYEEVLLLVK